jgi:hypothetical protein
MPHYPLLLKLANYGPLKVPFNPYSFIKHVVHITRIKYARLSLLAYQRRVCAITYRDVARTLRNFDPLTRPEVAESVCNNKLENCRVQIASLPARKAGNTEVTQPRRA